MIFRTVNDTLEKSSYKIELKNIDLASGHWGSEKEMFSYFDEIENFLYDKDTFNKKLVLHALALIKANHRIKDVKFYRIPEENKLILFAMTEVGKFASPELFTREMTISFKKEKFVFSIVEVIKKEFEQIKSGEKTMPANWILDEKLTDKIKLLKEYQ
jgi:hypothetical protein